MKLSEWSLIKINGVPIKRDKFGHRERCAQREDNAEKYTEKIIIYKTQREEMKEILPLQPLGRTNSANNSRTVRQ